MGFELYLGLWAVFFSASPSFCLTCASRFRGLGVRIIEVDAPGQEPYATVAPHVPWRAFDNIAGRYRGSYSMEGIVLKSFWTDILNPTLRKIFEFGWQVMLGFLLALLKLGVRHNSYKSGSEELLE